MTIVEPCSNGLGSDAFCILWDGKQLHGLNASRPGAGGLDAATTSARKYGADATTPPKRGWDSRHRARRGGRLGGAERALRQAALRRPAGAGDRDRRARLRRAGGGAAEVGGRDGRRAGVAAGLCADLPAAGPRAAGRRAVRDAGARRARCAPSPRPRARPSTAARSPRPRRACAREHGGAHDRGRLRRLPARVGRAHRARTTAATRCTRFRPTARASPR